MQPNLPETSYPGPQNMDAEAFSHSCVCAFTIKGHGVKNLFILTTAGISNCSVHEHLSVPHHIHFAL